MNPLHISDIFIYPIKSLAGISANESKVESRGLQYDRRWVLVNDDNVFVHQRDHHEMVFLQPEITGDKIQVTHKQDPGLSVQIPITPESSTRELVTVWADQCPAVEVSKEVSTWFSSVMGFPCRLMHMPDDSVRPTDPDFSVNQDDKVSFADGYPLLAISEASMRLLNEKTEEYMSSSRFRANIIIKGGHPHIEDELGVFEINEITFYGVKPCTRCVMTTVDPETSKTGKEPLKTLATYRRDGNKIQFGQNIIPKSEGLIRKGDTISVKERLKPIAF